MYAIEFESFVKNNLLKIPSQYKDFYSKKVKVILMIEENTFPKHKENFILSLMSKPIKSLNFTPLERDEIYERG